MSSFYDDASLVVIPSGYKTSKIYAEKPTDGSGDLTFTRASGATRVGANGLIEEVRTNIALQSQAFNTTWSAVSATVSANTTANPLDGVVNADTITLSAGSTQKYVTQAITMIGNFTVSCYIKSGTQQFIQFLLGTDTVPFANFDLVNGTANGTNSTARIVAVGNGWYRCSMSFTATTANAVFITGVDSLAAARFASTTSTGTFIAFGYQAETGDLPTNYIPTTTTTVSVGPVNNVPRLDYLGSSCPRLLLEPQRTNLVVQSNFLNLWSRFQNTTKSFDSAVLDPTGNPASRYLRNSASTALASRDGVSILASTTYTFSYYARKGNYSAQLAEVGFGSNNVRVTYNFDTNTFSSSTAGTQTLLSTSAQAVGNGWVRIALTFTGSITTVNCAFLIGDAVNNFVYIYGTQLEAGAYATSYIPTLSASVTRVADEARKSAISSLIGQTEGTIFGEMFTLPSGNESMLSWVRNSTAGTYGNFIFVAANSSARPRVQVLQGGVQQCEILGSNTLTSGWHKFALAYKANDFAFYVDGALIGTATSGSVPTGLDQLFIDQYTDGGIRNASKKQFLLFKTRLTNAQLAELTTL